MIELRRLLPEDAWKLTQLYIENRENLKPFEPIREEGFYTAAFHLRVLEKDAIDAAIYRFGIWQGEDLVGQIKLSQILQGAAQSAILGYFIDKEQRKMGYMSTAVESAVEFAFSKLLLHRIQASVMPVNLPSIRVLEKCGFECIGLAKKYLFIQGIWQDHYLYQRCKE